MADNFTAIPNRLLDHMADLSPAEFKVLLAIYRLIAGYKEHRKSGRRQISIGELEKMTDLSRQGVVNTFDKIQELGYAIKITDGRVTHWQIDTAYIKVVNSVDYENEVVKPVDQPTNDASQLSVLPIVNTVDQDSQLSGHLPYIERKEEKKEERKDKNIPPTPQPAQSPVDQHIITFEQATGKKRPRRWNFKRSNDYTVFMSDWYEPMVDMKELANGRTDELIGAAVLEMDKRNLSMGSPKSIYTVFCELHRKGGRPPMTAVPANQPAQPETAAQRAARIMAKVKSK